MMLVCDFAHRKTFGEITVPNVFEDRFRRIRLAGLSARLNALGMAFEVLRESQRPLHGAA